MVTLTRGMIGLPYLSLEDPPQLVPSHCSTGDYRDCVWQKLSFYFTPHYMTTVSPPMKKDGQPLPPSFRAYAGDDNEVLIGGRFSLA